MLYSGALFNFAKSMHQTDGGKEEGVKGRNGSAGGREGDGTARDTALMCQTFVERFRGLPEFSQPRREINTHTVSSRVICRQQMTPKRRRASHSELAR